MCRHLGMLCLPRPRRGQRQAPSGAYLDVAILRDLKERAPALLDRLPPPYRQVAILQLIEGWSRREIIAWLQTWLPISESSCQRIFARTHEMLPFVVSGKDPQKRWPGRYSRKKNPWYLHPPPSFSRL